MLVALALPREGRVGQWHFERLELADVVGPSTLVLLASPAAPATTAVDIPYTGQLGPAGTEIPPFRTATSHYVVKAVRWPDEPRPGLPAVGATVDTWAASAPQYMRDHFEYHVVGISKHPIYGVYEPSYGPGAAPDPIVLLLSPRAEGGYWLHATEAPTKLPDILGLLRGPASLPGRIEPD